MGGATIPHIKTTYEEEEIEEEDQEGELQLPCPDRLLALADILLPSSASPLAPPPPTERLDPLLNHHRKTRLKHYFVHLSTTKYSRKHRLGTSEPCDQSRRRHQNLRSTFSSNAVNRKLLTCSSHLPFLFHVNGNKISCKTN